MKKMTDKERKRCHAIIHSASAAAAVVGAGLAQLPCSDNAVITPIQIAMTISLGKVFELSLSEGAAMAALATVATGTVGRAVSQMLLGWIPGLGNALNSATAASITETAGWLLAADFAKQARSECA